MSPSIAPPGFNEPTFGQRLVGALLDGLVLLPIGLLLAAMGGGAVVMVIGITVASAYHIVLTARDGKTVGKRIVGTRVVDRARGGAPSLSQSGWRWLAFSGVGVVAAFLPVLSPAVPAYGLAVMAGILMPPLHRGLHDRAAGTVVSADEPPSHERASVA